MSKLSVGLVGLGIMGKNHARVLANLDSVKLIGVVEPLQDKLIHSSNLNIVELDELLEMKPDYCVVATPAKTHKDIAIKIAKKYARPPLNHNGKERRHNIKGEYVINRGNSSIFTCPFCSAFLDSSSSF